MLFTRFAAGMSSPGFFVSHLREGHWDEPKQATLPDGASPAPFSISPDGERLYFTHLPDSTRRSRLWVAERDGEGWKNARPLGGALEKWDGDQASPSVTSDGTLYFTSNRQQGSGGWDIYRSILRNGEYQEPELVGGWKYRRISTLREETSVTVAPDGSFLVFSSTGAPNGFGASDLYIVELSIPEGWSAWPWNLGPLVNSPADEVDPRLSADGKRLYFHRSGDIYEIDLESLRRPPAESTVWKRRAEMPTPREWPQLAVSNGRIHVYGGLTGGLGTGKPHAWTNQVDVFDPITNSWSTLPAAPDEWKQATLVSMDNRLFLFRRGGPGVAEYRPESKQWVIRTPASPFVLGEAWPFQTRTVVLGRKAYTMFSAGGLRPFSYFVEYDFDTGAWTPKQSMPSPAPQLVVFAGRIYAFGDDLSVYDPMADKWATLARIEMPRFESAVVAYRDEIWLIGGHGVRGDDLDGDISPTVVRFDPRHNTWSRGPALPWLRAGAAAVAVNGRMFVFGGLRPGTVFTHEMSVIEYNPSE